MKILIVDDDPICEKLLSIILKDFGQTRSAINGEQGIELVEMSFEQKQPFDVIFLDIMMPKVDGHEALKEIRKIEERNGVPLGMGAKIVMVTAMDNRKNVLSAFSEGCEHYVVKPVKQEKILEIMAELTE